MLDFIPYCPFCGSCNLKITLAGYGEKTVGYVAVFAQRGNKNADTGIAQNKRTLVCCAIGST